MFNQDFNELLSIFNDYEVKYLVVGTRRFFRMGHPPLMVEISPTSRALILTALG